MHERRVHHNMTGAGSVVWVKLASGEATSVWLIKIINNDLKDRYYCQILVQISRGYIINVYYSMYRMATSL